MRAPRPAPFAQPTHHKRITPESLEAFYRRLGDRFDEYHKDWRRRFLAAHEQTVEVVGQSVAAELGVIFDISHPLLRKLIDERVNMIVGDMWPAPGTIPQNTFDAIKKTIADGMEAGDGIPQLQARVRKVFNRGLVWNGPDGERRQVLSAAKRARLIARTESAFMANGASVRQVQSTGLPYDKIWATQMDDRVREEHQELEGERVSVGEAFSNGLEWPGEPNCRCFVLFELRMEAAA